MTQHYKKEKVHNTNISTLLDKYSIKATKKQENNLHSILKNTICFNKRLEWDKHIKNIYLVTTIEMLIEIYVLRSIVYAELNYDKEFPDTIKGLNFDSYDEHSAILYTKRGGNITGTCRVIFDKGNTLPMDKYFPLKYLRVKNKKLAELSRLIISRKEKGLSQEPKYLTKGAYLVMSNNKHTTLMSVMVEEHYKLYDKFGGFKIEDEIRSYGSLGLPFIITSWEISQISKFFKKVFLST
jgi:hypothetical protein